MSCKSKVENAISGLWTIDTIYFENTNIKSCLNGNSFKFDFDRKARIPEGNLGCMLTENATSSTAKIYFFSDENDAIPYRLKIDTKNVVFNGVHKVVFYDDQQRKELKMEIFSKRLYVLCHKGLFNYEKEKFLINELVEKSWINRP